MRAAAFRLSLIVCLSVASCASDPPVEDRPRGQIGKADLTGSCENSDCDGPSPDGTCFCDDECESWGDCCSDWSSICEPPAACGEGERALCPDGFGCVLDPAFGGEARDWPHLEIEGELRFECESWSTVDYCCDPDGNVHPACAAAAGPIRLVGDAGDVRIEVFPRGLALLFGASILGMPDDFTIPVTDHETGLSALTNVRMDEDTRVWIGMELRRDPADEDRMVLKTDLKVMLLSGSYSGTEGMSNQAYPWGYVNDALHAGLDLPQLDGNFEACGR